MSYTSIYRDAEGAIRRDLAPSELEAAQRAEGGLLWVHMRGASESDGELLSSVFGIHPLAVQDALSPEYQAPKVDDYGAYLFVKLHGVDHSATEEVVVTTELDLFIGEHWVISSSHSVLPAIEHVLESLDANSRPLERGSVMLAHVIIDALVDSILPTIHRMDDVADEIEERSLDAPHRDLLVDILRLKRSAMHVQRVMVPQRDILQRLSRGEYRLIHSEALMYYRDIYDHVVRVEDLVQTMRERAESALTTYLSAVNIRQNETMRVLAIVTSAFLPLTLLAGVYGMNFEYMPELHWRWTYPAVLAVMAVVTLGVTWWLFGPKWLQRGKHVAKQTFRVERALLHDAMLEAARLRERVLAGDGPESEEPRASR